MYVKFIANTKGTLEDGTPWKSRTALCIEAKNGNEFVKVYKLGKGCDIPLPDENVVPLFDEHGRVARFDKCD